MSGYVGAFSSSYSNAWEILLHINAENVEDRESFYICVHLMKGRGSRSLFSMRLYPQ